MPKWIVNFAPEAEDDLDKLDYFVKDRIIEKLGWIQDNFDGITPLPLGNEWRGFYKIRIGDWRVIYNIEWEKYKIIVAVIGHRSKIYKMRKSKK